MTGDRPPAARLLLRVALVQLLLTAFCWIGVGFLNARETWLLEKGQAHQATRLLLVQMPLLGLVAAVALPVAAFARLLRETREPGLLDTDFVRKALGFPQAAALAGLFTSVLVFLVAGLRLRTLVAIPPVEAAKIGVLGLLTGNLLAVLSYFLLQRPAALLVRHALDQGAVAPAAPTFPIAKKILAACIAVMLLVAGFFGMVAVTSSQRYLEESSALAAERFLARLVDEASRKLPQGRGEWDAFLARSKPPAGSVVYAMTGGGALITTRPRELQGIEGHLLRSDFLASGAEAPPEGAFVVRWGDVRIVAREKVHERETIGVVVRPDPAVLRRVLRDLTIVTAEALAAALLLAAVAGGGITGPLRLLSHNASLYANETTEPSPTLSVATDDEIARLGADLDRMAAAQREARRQLQDASRRAERDAVLARVAHEIRNPLFGISSTLAALKHELGPGAHDESFAILNAESQRLSRLIDEMLAAGPAAVSPDRADGTDPHGA